MALRITCPHCGDKHRLAEPFPKPGSELHCACGHTLAISYPPGLTDDLRRRGKRFQGDLEPVPIPHQPTEEEDAPTTLSGNYLDIARKYDTTLDPLTGKPRQSLGDAARSNPGPNTRPMTSPPGLRSEGLIPEPPATPPPRRRAPTPPQEPPWRPQELAAREPDTDDAPAPKKPPTRPRGPSPLRQAMPHGLPAGPRPGPKKGRARGPDLTPGQDPSGSDRPAPSMSPEARRALELRRQRRRPRARLRRWVMRLAVLGLLFVLAGVGIVVATIVVYSEDLPSITDLGNYRPPTVTLVEDSQGRVLGEISEKRRYVVPYERFPQHLKDAFVAAEDAAFWDHQGIDPVGILRAAIRNVQDRGFSQGASTVTQQVAKNFLLTKEKKLERKIREMILATRIEDAFSKEHILYLYLNEIYLGSSAYGVEAASRIYFDKHVEELTLAESAILAGLPQRPSDYSPHKHWEKAKTRQKYVLGQMYDKGFIDAAQRDAGLAEDVKVIKKKNPMRVLAPSFTEHVRRHLVETYGHDRVYNEGLVVRTTCDLALQQHAQDVLVDGVTRMDNSIGWRGPKRQLEELGLPIGEFRRDGERKLIEAQHLKRDAAKRPGTRPERSLLEVDTRYEGVVLEVEKRHAVLGVGTHEVMIPASWTKWAYEPNPNRSWRRRALNDLTEALSVGDVVDVTIAAVDAQETEVLKGYKPAVGRELAAGRLYQAPDLQGALLSYDLDSGAVRAMVGGIDIERSEFNRAVQAQRQVGSTFKPVVYATAIETEKFTAGSMLLDAPLTYNTLGARLWKPGNYGEEYLGNITLRKALAMSRNVCTVRVLDILGTEDVYDMARRLAISSPMEKDLAMGLGAASLTMVEMTRAYSAFASGGELVEPYWIESVTDRDGNVLEQHTAAPREQVLSPEVASVMTWLLNQVARNGTAASSNQLGVHLAGKTGTTNDYKDGWFMGYSPGVVTGVWVGYDQPRSMGVSSTGGRTALPIWIKYMRSAWPKEMDRPFEEPSALQHAEIDEATGRVATGGRLMPFLRGTVPEGPAVELGQKSTMDLMTEDF